MKPMSEAHFAILRRHMVEVIGIHVDLASEELGKAALDERVLAAMHKVPRHRFVPPFLAPLAYQAGCSKPGAEAVLGLRRQVLGAR